MSSSLLSPMQVVRRIYLLAFARSPRQFRVIPPDGDPFTVWIYIWTVTHGGYPRSTEEFRIQMTGVRSPLALNPDSNGFTILLGWDPNLRVFAGFDISRHRVFTTGSPSCRLL